MGLFVCRFDAEPAVGDGTVGTGDAGVSGRSKMDEWDAQRAAIAAYMNELIRSNDTVTEFGLRKFVGRWAVPVSSVALEFCLQPPWVKVHKNDAYYSLHPENNPFTRAPRSRNGRCGMK